MVLGLLVLNLVLLILAIAIPPLHTASGPESDLGSEPGERLRDNLGGRASAETLLLTFSRLVSSNPPVAAEALAAVIGDPERFIATLTSVMSLLREPSSAIRLTAACAAHAIFRIHPELVQLCWPDPSPFGRLAVVTSIDHSDLSRAARSGTASLVAVIEQSMLDTDTHVRAQACARLGMLERTKALQLTAVAMTDADEDVRRIACEVIGILGDAETVPMLVENLAAADPASVPQLLRSLVAVGGRHLGVLTQLATTAQAPGNRAAAIRGLGAIGRANVVPMLTAMLHDPAKDVRRAAATAIADVALVAGSRSLPAATSTHLARQLEREQSSSVVLALLDAIEASRATAVLDSVLRRLPSLNPGVRERALEVMANVRRG
jgi:HEAT repeats